MSPLGSNVTFDLWLREALPPWGDTLHAGNHLYNVLLAVSQCLFCLTPHKYHMYMYSHLNEKPHDFQCYKIYNDISTYSQDF